MDAAITVQPHGGASGQRCDLLVSSVIEVIVALNRCKSEDTTLSEMDC
jgi:hypothetical protein